MTAVASTRGGARLGLGKRAAKPIGDGALALTAFLIPLSFVLALAAMLALLFIAYSGDPAKVSGVLLLVTAYMVFAALTNMVATASDAKARGLMGREKIDSPMTNFVLAVGAIGSVGSALAKALAALPSPLKSNDKPGVEDSLLGELFAQVYRSVNGRTVTPGDMNWPYIAFLTVLLLVALAIALGVAARINPRGWTFLATREGKADADALAARIVEQEGQLARLQEAISRLGAAVVHHRRQADEAVAQAGGLFEAGRDLSKVESDHLKAAEDHAARAEALLLEKIELERRAEETGRRVEALSDEAERLETDADGPASGRAAPPRRRAWTLVSAARAVLARAGETLVSQALLCAAAIAEACAQRDAALTAAAAARSQREALEDQVRAAEQSAREHEQAFARATAAGQAEHVEAIRVTAELDALRAELAELKAEGPYELGLSADRSELALKRQLPRGAYRVKGGADYDGAAALFLGALALQPINILAIAPPANSVGGGAAPALYVAFAGVAMAVMLYLHYRAVANVAHRVAEGANAARTPLIAGLSSLAGAAATAALLWGLWATFSDAPGPVWRFLALAIVVGLTPLIGALERRWRAPAALVLVGVAAWALSFFVQFIPIPPSSPATQPKLPPYVLRPATLLCSGQGSGTSGAWIYARSDDLQAKVAGCGLSTGDRTYVVVIGAASEEGGGPGQIALAGERARALAKAIKADPAMAKVAVLPLNLGQRIKSVPPSKNHDFTAPQRAVFVLEGKPDPARKAGPLIERARLVAALKAAGLDPDFYRGCEPFDLAGGGSPSAMTDICPTSPP